MTHAKSKPARPHHRAPERAGEARSERSVGPARWVAVAAGALAVSLAFSAVDGTGPVFDEAKPTRALPLNCERLDGSRPVAANASTLPSAAPSATTGYCPPHNGVVEVVYVPGLDEPGHPPLSIEEVGRAASEMTSDLQAATDGGERFMSEVVTASPVVAAEARSHMTREKDGTLCVDPNSPYAPSKLVQEHMADTIQAARVVEVVSGAPGCKLSVMEHGKKIVKPYAGAAQLKAPFLRIIDILGAGDVGDPRALEDTMMHEFGHKAGDPTGELRGLGHTHAISCISGGIYTNDPISPKGTFNLGAFTYAALHGEAGCGYSEYLTGLGDRYNEMGSAIPLPNNPNSMQVHELFTALQADYMSGRTPSTAGARTALLGVGVHVELGDRATPSLPYGALERLQNPIEYTPDGGSVERYTGVLFDCRTIADLNYVDIYATSDPGKPNLELLYTGTLAVPDNGSLTIANEKNLITFTSPQSGHLAITEALAPPGN